MNIEINRLRSTKLESSVFDYYYPDSIDYLIYVYHFFFRVFWSANLFIEKHSNTFDSAQQLKQNFDIQY